MDIEFAQKVLMGLEPDGHSPAAHGLKMAARRLGECNKLTVGGSVTMMLEDVVHVVAAAMQIPDELVTAVVAQAKLGTGGDQ